MKNRRLLASILAAAVVLLGMPPLHALGSGERGAVPQTTATLALSRVVVFSSGVSYYERDGVVSGDADVDFLFRTDDINDVLKSMVVRDLDGGMVGGVRYASRDPLEKSLKGFAIDLTGNPGLADILTQARGEPVLVWTSQRVSGAIVGVESGRDSQGGEGPLLNLMTASGLRSVPLNEITDLRFSNPRLDRDFRQALELLASGHDRDKKRVSVSFRGEGQRRVRIGYLLASPIWKTAYRLVLGGDGPFLQGWGIVENTTDEAWSDVTVSLVSGRPISFVMDLYEPLYVPRPRVEPELYRSLRPQSYEQDLSRAASKAAPPPAPAASAAPLLERSPSAAAGIDLRQGVRSMAQASQVGGLFQYAIDRPVTLARHQSAMLPIVNASVEATRLSIYDQSVLADHPLLGVRLRNTAGVDLMAGPITVFDGGVYAGDAQMSDLSSGAERLISYAVDLDTEVAPGARSLPEDLVSVRILHGSLIATRLQRRERTYTLKSSGASARTVLVEQPLDPDWDLVSPQEPTERTRDSYRFAVELPAAGTEGATRQLVVSEKRTVSQSVVLSTIPDDSITFYIGAREVSPQVKEALRGLASRKTALAATVAAREEQERKAQQIASDQARIRQNMAQLDRTSDLYRRYVATLESQESTLAAMRDRIDALRAQELSQRQELDDYMRSLEVD